MSEKVLIDRKLLADLLSQDRETRINAERSLYAQLANTTIPQPAAVEAVEVVAVAFITRAEKSGPKIAITLKKEDAEKQHKNWLSMSKIITTEPLMTVAQHNRIMAASLGSAEPTEYQQLSRYNNWDRIDKTAFDLGMLGSCPEKFRALYTHPSTVPAGCKVVPVELLASAARHLNDWLELDQCECEGPHYCGRTQVAATRRQLRAILEVKDERG